MLSDEELARMDRVIDKGVRVLLGFFALYMTIHLLVWIL